MKERLPVVLENLELPKDEFEKENEKRVSYGYVSILYLLSLMITIGSIIAVLVVRNRW